MSDRSIHDHTGAALIYAISVCYLHIIMAIIGVDEILKGKKEGSIHCHDHTGVAMISAIFVCYLCIRIKRYHTILKNHAIPIPNL